VRLIVQPDDGLTPILTAIKQARKSIEIMIFRFDRRELESALAAAVARGVAVRALIAHKAGEGVRALRKLELRLLEAGVTVARTDDDLVRYHSKYIIIDQSRLFVLGFNFTALDISSRSFGLEIRTKTIVKDAIDLFEADASRQPVRAVHRDLVVSPVNARERLGTFIKGARRELLIYDPKLSDARMIRLLKERIRAGVAVRVLGHVAKGGSDIPSEKLTAARLHVRAIVRDGSAAFIGSQSLKRLELDERRELGIIVREPKIARQVAGTFEADWTEAAPAPERVEDGTKDGAESTSAPAS
jgi:phosphatidylserine/phosphatidylglycerophosphate/cardiolipin synthase-like enzyme